MAVVFDDVDERGDETALLLVVDVTVVALVDVRGEVGCCCCCGCGDVGLEFDLLIIAPEVVVERGDFCMLVTSVDCCITALMSSLKLLLFTALTSERFDVAADDDAEEDDTDTNDGVVDDENDIGEEDGGEEEFGVVVIDDEDVDDIGDTEAADDNSV